MKPVSLLLLASCCCAAAVEPWSDARLSVKEGLECWFDASAENGAREALKLPVLRPGAEVDYWHDGSQFRRDLWQRSLENRPRLRRAKGSFFVDFDGANDFLAALLPEAIALKEATIFVYGAPRSNPGSFRAFLSWNAAARNDYQSGFNLDLGSAASSNSYGLNVEAAGTSGEKSLLATNVTIGGFHALTVVVGTAEARLFLDGAAQKSRSRKSIQMILQELTVGARCNDAGGGASHVNSFLAGQIAEILVFGRALPENERENVERYLAAKYAGLAHFGDDPAAPVEKSFVAVTNPPPIQMLVPGFVVRQLPLDLNNINNLVYSPDGRLFALGYDGNVYQLKDTDGDGLEDRADYFYRNDRNEIPATIGMAWGPGGLYVPLKGRVIRLRDKGDGTAEIETVASGWVAPAKFGGSSLDAVAITVDKEGAVYFGLGCDDWTGAYRVNKETGKSDYNIKSERGTILRVSPDWKQREVLATGLRWPSSLAFNSAGDLFCTDQEGATWLPNGNPFDELLHIQRGRLYGFPPQHPKYLPGVIDEPSAFDYAPQHESTCGLHFNDREKVFGPEWWRGDAIIAGESRGKIWRTKLVKTAAGYVGQNQIIACLSMLTLDAVPSPSGDLVVTCHSGLPDWGTGPQGKGKLFKISYEDRKAPQPVLAYAVSPTEARVVFDRPADPMEFRNLLKQASVTMGQYVTAGDRFESFRPGYQVVQNQMMEPRFELPVISSGISADGREVILHTAARRQALNYAIKLPNAWEGAKGLAQERATDVAFSLNGVEAEWRDSSERWEGWLPHLALDASGELTKASEEHRKLFGLMRHEGILRLRTQVDLWQMLHPATQPGSKLEYEYPPEQVTIVLEGPELQELKTAAGAKVERPARNRAVVTVTSARDQWLPLDLSLKTGPRVALLQLSWHTVADPRPRALALRRLFVPWAVPASVEQTISERSIPEITGGDWQRGRMLFYGDRAGCYKCHRVAGEGGTIGPDLSNLVHRDYASVMKDITQPSAAINPDHLSYNVELKDGDQLSGVIVGQDDAMIRLGVVDGRTVEVPMQKVASVKPSAVSLMPENLLQALSAGDQKDLLTFLLIGKPAEGKGSTAMRQRAQR